MALVDISERREMEGQLQLAQRMESLGRLAGGVAHDINNVLAGIQGVVSSLELKPAAAVPFGSELALLQRATLRGRDLVRRLLDFTRADLESPRLLDLNEFVQGEVAILEHTTRKRVHFITHLAPGLPPILGESSALSTTLMNLCVNALDAIHDRGTIQLRTRDLGDGRVELAVEDDGCGMTAEVRARAAEPFFTTKPPGEGTGLGLSQAFGLMRAHGGSVEIRSEPGRGTSVALRFPVAEGGGVPVRATVDATPQVPPLHILVVDDDELIQATLPLLLEDLGHTVVAVAHNGPEALERLTGGLSLELVMLDYNMPGLTGLETLEELRKRGSAVSVLMTTGLVEPGVEQAIRAYGNAGVLRKPFTLEEFNAALAGLLGT